MILRQYGNTVQSVEIDFNSKALTEIGFRRDREHSMSTEEFESGYERVSVHEFDATAEGDVQDEVEQVMLADLESQLREVLDGLGEDEVAFVESEQGNDWPKTRTETKNVVVEGENRLYFYSSVDPVLRVGVYRKT
ncbi:MAG: hypothetical protein R3324_19255 [Halobacteriales archaeon]|nr:hypothetical protein [Halobacteriales archaeon]